MRKQPRDLSLLQALEWYRSGVELVAAGGRLTADGCARVDAAIEFLGLPSWAWDRDVHATTQYRVLDDEYRRAELEVVHPHILLPIDQAARLWAGSRARFARRRMARLLA